MRSSLRAVAAALDECWWYLGGSGFSMTDEVCSRLRQHHGTEQQVHDHWMHLLAEFVEHDTSFGRVGKPGFFRQLADSVDFSWACYFAIEGRKIPLASLQAVAELDGLWFGPFEALPPNVMLTARDIDSAYQEYGFRDAWMYQAVRGDLRGRGLLADAVM